MSWDEALCDIASRLKAIGGSHGKAAFATFLGNPPTHGFATALPSMRANRSGIIVNVSSAAAMGGNVAFGIYCASKFALEGATEALALEVQPFGISVVLIEPGAFATNLAPAALVTGGDADYAPIMDALQASLATVGATFDDSELVVDCILRVVDDPNLPLRVMVGSDSLAAADARAKMIAEQFEASSKTWQELKAGRT